MDDLKFYASNDNQLRSLLETVRVFSMKFGLDKCRKSTILKRKCSKTESIQLITSEENIKELNNVEFYRYLGIQESNLICHAATKSQLTEEYFCRLRKILTSELNSINFITAINTCMGHTCHLLSI